MVPEKLCFNILMGLQYEPPWLKGQSLELIYSRCHIRLNISSENIEFGFNSFKKMNFSKKKSHLNELGSKFDLDTK